MPDSETIDQLSEQAFLLLEPRLRHVVGEAVTTIVAALGPQLPPVKSTTVIAVRLDDSGLLTVRFAEGYGFDVGPVGSAPLFVAPKPHGRNAKLHVVPPDDPDGPTAA